MDKKELLHAEMNKVMNKFDKYLHDVVCFKDRESCIKDLEQREDKHERHIFQCDINENTRAKKYFHCTYKQSYMISVLRNKPNEKIKENKCVYGTVYENIRQDTRNNGIKCKLHIDIDVDSKDFKFIEGSQDKTFNYYLNAALDHIKKCLFDYYKITNYSYICLKSEQVDSKSKVSMHIIFNNVIVSNLDCLKDILYHDYKTERHPILQNESKKYALDPAIYKVQGAFRNYKCSKIGKENALMFHHSYNYTKVGEIDYNKPEHDLNFYLDTLCNHLSDGNMINGGVYNMDIEETMDLLNHPYVDKSKYMNRATMKVKDECYEDDDENDDDVDGGEIHKLVMMLNEEYYSDYKHWSIIMQIIKNYVKDEDDAYALIHKFSSQWVNYKAYEVNKAWRSCKKNYNFSIKPLYKYAYASNPKEFMKIRFNEESKCYKSFKFNQKYILEHGTDTTKQIKMMFNDWYDSVDKKNKCIAIHSVYGSGKTQCLKHIFNEYNPSKILFITYRQSLSSNLCGTLDEYKIKNYMGMKPSEMKKQERLTCQLESIHKLRTNLFFEEDGEKHIEVPSYDLICLDEVKSLLNHFSSNTVKSKGEVYTILVALLRKAKKIILLDGDFDNQCYSIVSNIIKSPIKVLENEYKGRTLNWNFMHYELDFQNKFIQDLKKGKKLFVVSMSSEKGLQYEKIIKDMGKTSIYHYSKSDDSYKALLQNVNKLWINYDVVIISPSVESGVDFNVVDYFDNIYVILSLDSTSDRGLIQMTNRIRHTKNNEVYCFMNKLKYDTERPPLYNYEKVKVLYENSLGYKEFDVDDDGNMYEHNNNFNSMMIYNQIEYYHKQRDFFMYMLIQRLKRKGHTYMFNEEIIKKNVKTDNITIKNIIDAEDISLKLYKEYKMKQERNEALMSEKYALEKYYYKKTFMLDDVNEETMKLCFRKQHIISNNMAINGEIDASYKTCDDNYVDFSKEIRIKRLNMLNDVLKVLKFKNEDSTFNTGEIEKSQLENYVKEALKCELFSKQNNTLFGRKQKDLSTFKAFMCNLKSNLVDYGINLCTRRGKHETNGRKSYYWVEQDDFITDVIRKMKQRYCHSPNGVDNLIYECDDDFDMLEK